MLTQTSRFTSNHINHNFSIGTVVLPSTLSRTAVKQTVVSLVKNQLWWTFCVKEKAWFYGSDQWNCSKWITIGPCPESCSTFEFILIKIWNNSPLFSECCKNDSGTCSKVRFASSTQDGVKLGLVCAQFIFPSLIESLKKSTVFTECSCRVSLQNKETWQ